MSVLPDQVIFDQLTRAFARSQDMARPEIVRRQTALLERLIRHADAHVPFYRDSKRLKPLFRSDGAFDMAGWDDIPILTRNEAKANEAALQALQVPADMGALETRATSGSTGTPLKFRQTRVQRMASEVLLNRHLLWRGLWPIRRAATHGPGSAVKTPGPNLLQVPAALDFEEQVEILRERRTTHLFSSPSMGAGWADAAGPKKLPDLIAFIATGEVFRPEIRRKIEEKLGGKALNLYSTSEIGPLAGEGPDGRLWINEENTFFEGPASRGASPTRVVVTPFYAFGTPLIRYAPGDFVLFSTAKSRGAAGLRRLEEVIGRQRNLLRQPDGRYFLPGRIEARNMEKILDYREWQLVQTSLTEIVMKIVTPTPPTSEQLLALRDYVRNSLPNHQTDVVIVDRIESNLGGGKAYEMFVSHVDGRDDRM